MALTRVAIALVITLLAAVILARAAPRMGLIQRLVLQEGLAGSVAAAPDVETESGEALDLTGQEGEVLTALRPFGKARIGGRRVEVTTEGGFVEAGTTVRVCRVEGRNVVVRPVTPDVEEEA